MNAKFNVYKVEDLGDEGKLISFRITEICGVTVEPSVAMSVVVPTESCPSQGEHSLEE